MGCLVLGVGCWFWGFEWRGRGIVCAEQKKFNRRSLKEKKRESQILLKERSRKQDSEKRAGRCEMKIMAEDMALRRRILGGWKATVLYMKRCTSAYNVHFWLLLYVRAAVRIPVALSLPEFY